jgi:drug/metabolite transporter (DMT)-like permease
MSEKSPLWLRTAPFLFLFFWSSGYPVSKLGMQYAAPFSFLMLRYALVLVLLAPLALWLRPPLPKRRIDWLHIAVVGFLIQTLYFGGCYTAFASGTSSGAVALIVSLQPLLVAVLAPLLVGGERTHVQGWVGLGLGFLGAVIVISGYEHVAHFPFIGVGASIAALFGMTAATLYEKRFGVTQHPITANMIQYVVGFLTTLPIALVHFHAQADPHFIALLFYLVIANSIISLSLFLAMVRAGQAAKVSSLLYLVPPLAALMSWGMLHEPMTLTTWAGMAVAGLGVTLARWQRKAP